MPTQLRPSARHEHCLVRFHVVVETSAVVVQVLAGCFAGLRQAFFVGEVLGVVVAQISDALPLVFQRGEATPHSILLLEQEFPEQLLF